MKQPIITRYICLITLLILAGCDNEKNVYTLYRTGINLVTKVEDEHLKIPIATFDVNVDDDEFTNDNKYNLANCEFAKDLFTKSQPHYAGSIYSNIKIKYWCEKDRYKE